MLRVVITGGPSTGKTSLINSLGNNGFNVFNEAARKVIQQQLINNVWHCRHFFTKTNL